MPFARSPRPEKPNLTAFSDRLLRLPAVFLTRQAAFCLLSPEKGRGKASLTPHGTSRT